VRPTRMPRRPGTGLLPKITSSASIAHGRYSAYAERVGHLVTVRPPKARAFSPEQQQRWNDLFGENLKTRKFERSGHSTVLEDCVQGQHPLQQGQGMLKEAV
jgi:hypothetical protein